MTIRDVARFASQLTFADLPENTVRRARQGLRDTIGTALAGSATRAAATAAAAFAEDAGPFRTLAPGAPAQTATAAGFRSALAASALDFDDGHYQGGAIHPSSVIVPTILVAASNRPASTEELLVAQVAAYEVAVRLAHLLWPADEATDRWYCTGTAACVGAAAGAAKVRGADEDGIRRAMQTAWAHAPMAALQWPMVKEAIGWSSATALNAVVLGEAGFMAAAVPGQSPDAPAIFPPTPFDEPRAAGDPFVTSLGSVFEIERSYLKPYPACRYTHTAVDVLTELLAGDVAVDQVEAITVRTHRWATFLDYRRPPSLEHAQYSYPFALGTLLAKGRITPAEMTEAALADEAVLGFADRIEVVHDPALDAHLPDHYATRLEVRLVDGTVIDGGPRLDARGDVTRPLTDDELRAKFLLCAEPVLGGSAAALADELDRDGGTAALWALIAG
ncbi:hypothetical protein EFK50_08790 [Nocardioides marmoriginsengisoli]|uniref:MmgE/PrpD family protein n=1 Tax=Nocardioides marmoriginsengisoli TaxID=661483 RepID=A0A3N0CER2_9ACTN|nr:MmgE/PrpD family protein [Nocardioides marmoriginsengisoli]RNL61918.1 hypothetical protein EFK50_08790 [Nocardioides marmoriginsengisoli]